MEIVSNNVEPFDMFISLYKVLVYLGLYKINNKPKYLLVLHQIYRALILTWSFIYALQHFIFIATVFNDNKDQAFESLLIFIPQLNFLGKMASMMFYSRLESLRELMCDAIFTANSAQDRKYIREDQIFFRRLIIGAMISTTLTASVWTLTPILKRIQDETFILPSYFPFDTKSTLGFILAVFLEHSFAIWLGYGHVVINFIMVCHLSQAAVQLKIIRYNLQSMCDSEKGPGNVDSHVFRYVDDKDTAIMRRFRYYVKRYEKVVWFTRQVISIFNITFTVQFITTSVVICLAMYKISVLPPTSAEFLFLVGFCSIIQLQLFASCYFAEAIQYESQFVADAAYLSDWSATSPRFRRMILIAMARWNIPITSYVAGVLPLSLSTFILITRGAFSLFSVLKATRNE